MLELVIKVYNALNATGYKGVQIIYDLPKETIPKFKSKLKDVNVSIEDTNFSYISSKILVKGN